jgi:Na+-translocating ferredoxin:NAD+ oxidoreductase RnfD subunit
MSSSPPAVTATVVDDAEEPLEGGPLDPITRSPLHAGVDVGRYYAMHFVAATFAAGAGVMLYGRRAVASVVIVVLAAMLSALLWQRIGARGGQVRLVHVGWLAFLLAMMLPAHWATRVDAAGYGQPWPILVAAGMTLSALMWVLGGIGAGRIHPVLVCYLLLQVLYGAALVPNRVLQRGYLVTGDLFHAPHPDQVPPSSEPWISAAGPGIGEAIWRPSAAQQLSHFTTGTETNDPRTWISLDVLLRDRMPPLEDFLIGGEPGPIGAGCGLGVIVGGLFLLYRGLIDYRIPLLIFVFAYLAMLVLPIPVVITDQPQYRWLVLSVPGLSWQTTLTFVHYELLAGPMLFMSFFIATSPSVRPVSKSARAVYAALIGILTAAFQLYASVSYGPYVALLIASLLTPTFDKLLRPRPLV